MNKKVKHIVSFSGGKDSTAMLLRMIDEGMKIDEIVFCHPKFSDNLSGEFPEMLDFIKKVDKYCIDKIGVGVTIIESEKSFLDTFFRTKLKGNNKGKIYGWPYTIGAWCNSRLKMVPINKYFKSRGDHIRYIGIASDEYNRLVRLKKNEIAPLFKWKMTENDARLYCEKRDMLNPLYNKFDRLGCWFCPKQNLKALEIVYKDYPNLWDELIKIDKYSEQSFKPNYSLLYLEKRFKNNQ